MMRVGVLSMALALASCSRAPAAESAPTRAPAPASASASASAPASAPASALAPALAPASAPATATASGQRISLPDGGSGWLQTPTTPGKHPALLVIQEWWGMNDWIKENVARFASHGYVALAVDLYRGKATSDPGEAHELMRGLSEDRAMDDMKSAFDWLAARPEVDASRIGIIGWCMGGGYALAFAVAEPRLRAAVVNYGRLVSSPPKIAAIHAALMGNFAGDDRGIAPADVRAFADALRADHKDADIKIYPGAKHAFMNPNNKDGYDAAAANDAWARIDRWFATKL
jgi:carboxymethylenebutenolidase